MPDVQHVPVTSKLRARPFSRLLHALLTDSHAPSAYSVMNHASRAFWNKYGELPEQVRALADKNYKLLAANPRHPSLQFKKVGRYWSARIGSDFRAIGVDVDDGILWIWIGPHDEYNLIIRS